MLQNKITYAVAGEVVQGPYDSASKQVRKNGLTEKIVVRLADGLDAVQPEDKIDTVVVAGMGDFDSLYFRRRQQKNRLAGSNVWSYNRMLAKEPCGNGSLITILRSFMKCC